MALRDHDPTVIPSQQIAHIYRSLKPDPPPRRVCLVPHDVAPQWLQTLRGFLEWVTGRPLMWWR